MQKGAAGRPALLPLYLRPLVALSATASFAEIQAAAERVAWLAVTRLAARSLRSLAD